MATRKSTAPKKSKAPLESAIQRQTIDALKWRTDVIAWRTNSGGARLVGAGGRVRPVFFGVKGGGDITGVLRPWGVHFEIEIKREDGTQSDLQEKHEMRVRAAGGIYILARSAGEAMASLDAEARVLEEKFGRLK